MLRDWDLWPIYLDQGWVDAESAKRMARWNRQIARIVVKMRISADEATARLGRLAHALAHPATRR